MADTVETEGHSTGPNCEGFGKVVENTCRPEEVLEGSLRGAAEVMERACGGFLGAAQKTSITCVFYAQKGKDREVTLADHLGECLGLKFRAQCGI